MTARTISMLAVLFAVSVSAAPADRGSIPFRPGVKVFEPTQRAMIAWNGEEEILLLSTDLRASEKTKVLEVIPLPAEPAVKKGDVEVFRKATALINSKIRRRPRRLAARGAKAAVDRPPAGEVTFHKKIGAHDVSVAHVLDSDGFIQWVEEYLEKAGADNPTIPAPLKAVVAEYLDEEFTWFVFDVVDLDDQTRTNDAIQYRFATRSLYYPLKITRSETGDTSIDLLVLTPRLLRDFPGYPMSRVRLLHRPVDISSAEVRSLSKDMDDLLDHRDDLKLRIWKIDGQLSLFRSDLIAR